MKFSLRYGQSSVDFSAPSGQFEILGHESSSRSLSDAEIGTCFENPIGSRMIEEIVSPGESVLIVVPDATRATGCDSIVNLLVRRLIANGTMPYEIGVIFATGIHRGVTVDEKRRLLTPFIFQRIKTFDHNAVDLMRVAGLEGDRFRRFGDIDGAPIELNRLIFDFDRVIIVGGIGFHYFAGFTGGRKLICPGLASAGTIAATHRRAFDFDLLRRRSGVGPGLLDGNPVHESFVDVARHANAAFAVNSIVDSNGDLTSVFCGDWIESHRAACTEFAATHSIEISELRDLVIVSCGGSPHDINLIQAHKALEAASRACSEGGTILLIAECADGLGRDDFLKWFQPGSSSRTAEMLCERYEVNGQTAWSLLDKAERFDVRILTNLDSETVGKMRMKKADSAESIIDGRKGYVLPFGAKFLFNKTAI